MSIISNQISSLLKSEIFRNTGMLVSGTVFAQLIPLLLQPVLRRFFEPEVFGAYAVYISILAILIMAASLRYDQAVVLPKLDKQAANLVFISLILSLVFSLIVFVIVIIWIDEILVFLNLKSKFASFLYLLPLGVFLSGSYQSLNSWLIRQKAFKSLGFNKFVRRLFEGAGQFSLGLFKINDGLLVGDIIGNLANLAVFSYQSIKHGLSFKWISLIKIRYLLKKYIVFPKYNLLPILLSSASYFLPTIFINKFYGQEAAAYFDLSKMLLSVPIALGGTALANVLLQRYAQKKWNNLSIKRELYKLFAFISILAFAEVLLISFFGTHIFLLFFGKNWEYSGVISKWLVWPFALNFVVSSFSSIFVALGRIKLYSLWQIIYFFAITILTFLAYLPFEKFLRLYAFIEIISYSLAIFFVFLTVYRYESDLAKQTR